MKQMTRAVHIWAPRFLNLALFWSVATVMPLFGQAATQSAAHSSSHADHEVPAQLVKDVRKATRQYINVNNAGPAGYIATFGCLTGPDHGAMGIHYINNTLVNDGQILLEQPEALIYEPIGNARRLVGVEYIVDSATWLAAHDNVPPMIDGQGFQLVGAPNRFGLNPFFELHVWAWKDNPQGAFVDWNNDVTCELLNVPE